MENIMRFPRIRRITILFFVLLIAIYLGSILFFVSDFFQKNRDYIRYQEDLFQTSIDNVLGSYEEFSNFIFYSEVDTESILRLVARAKNADDEERTLIRTLLYDELFRIYTLSTEYHFSQLQFHLPNGDSFLRFHSPEIFGDNLFNVRESVRIANQEKKYVFGFEEGRILSAYRFVYPLFYQYKHIGSVEISVSMSSVIEELNKSGMRRDIGFLMDKYLVKSTVFESEMYRYLPSDISDHYVYDTDVLKAMKSNQYSIAANKDKDFMESLKSLVEKDVASRESFSHSMIYKDKAYLIQFISVRDLKGNHAGYLYSISENTFLTDLNSEIKLILFLASFTLILVVVLFTVIIRTQGAVRRLAMLDPLTKAYNRSSFYEFASKATSEQHRNKGKITVAMLDIDRFKKVNDTYGHGVGDIVLKQLSEILQKSMRGSDVMARFGGEEFVLLFPNTDLKLGTEIVERIRRTIEETPFPQVEHITVSIGVTLKLTGEDIDDAILLADEALYEAKATGRNRVVAKTREITNGLIAEDNT